MALNLMTGQPGGKEINYRQGLSLSRETPRTVSSADLFPMVRVQSADPRQLAMNRSLIRQGLGVFVEMHFVSAWQWCVKKNDRVVTMNETKLRITCHVLKRLRTAGLRSCCSNQNKRTFRAGSRLYNEIFQLCRSYVHGRPWFSCVWCHVDGKHWW